MNANEIIIGGWYLLDGKPIKAEGYCRGNVFYHTGYECGLYELEPIPLTETILENNGWMLKRDKYNRGGVADGMISGIRRWHPKHLQDSFCIVCFSNGSFGLPILSRLNGIKFVHELQQALLICGLDDIVEEFKVS